VSILQEHSRLATAAARAMVLVGCALIVPACSSPATEQRSAPVTDARGCPDLRGSYSVYVDTAGTGVNFDGTPFEELPFREGSWVALTSVAGVVIDTDAVGAVSFRFRLADEDVMDEIRMMDEYRPQQYRDWYGLLKPAGREAYVGQHGEAAYQQRVAELGPTTEAGLTLRHGRDFSCEDGAMLIPRPSGNPIRLTRNGNGDLAAESREYRTFGVTVWCGDGCKDMQIPTGVYTGKLVWAQAPDPGAWSAAAIRDLSALSRPRLEVEAEQARVVAETRQSNENRYASLDTIRGRFAALAAGGVQLLGVEFAGTSVRVNMGFADAAVPLAEQDARIEQLIAVVDERQGGALDRRSEVQLRLVCCSPTRREVDFTLRDGPLVLR
jgi:hypothetical protein